MIGLAVTSILLPTLYVAFLPALTHMQWANGTFASPHDRWTVSHMVRTPQANGTFAIATSCVVYYAWFSYTYAVHRRFLPLTIGCVLFTIGWVLVVVVPVESASDACHMLGVGLGAAGAILVLLSVGYVQAWRRAWWLVMATVVAFVASSTAVSSDHIGFFVIECVATLVVALFFPCMDAARYEVVLRV